MVCAFEKGRGKTWGLNSICRRAAAYQLGLAVQWRLRHVPTDDNVADEGSRRFDKKRYQNVSAKKVVDDVVSSTRPSEGERDSQLVRGPLPAPPIGHNNL